MSFKFFLCINVNLSDINLSDTKPYKVEHVHYWLKVTCHVILWKNMQLRYSSVTCRIVTCLSILPANRIVGEANTTIHKYSLLLWSHMILTLLSLMQKSYDLKKFSISWHRTAETNPVAFTRLVASVMLYNLLRKCSLWAFSSLISDNPRIYSLFLYFLIVLPCVCISSISGSRSTIFSVSSEILFMQQPISYFLSILSSAQVVIATIS